MVKLAIYPGTFDEFAERHGFTESDEEYAAISYREALERHETDVATGLGISVEALRLTAKEHIAELLGEMGIELSTDPQLNQDS